MVRRPRRGGRPVLTQLPAEVPDGDVGIPAAVAALAAGEAVVPVWRNGLGGLTFRLSTARYVKWAPVGTPETDHAGEALRLDWAGRWTDVPRVVEVGSDDDGTWLVTAALPGRSAVDPSWLARPRQAALGVGAGLRRLHDALPVEECPWTWSVADRVALLSAGREAAVAELGPVPPVDRLVVCHGDPCMPNTLLDDAGRAVGHVDLGRLGVADRWADLAVAAANTAQNYGPGYEHLVTQGYGVAPDPARQAFYSRLWDLGDRST